jgi:hypothetical protein
LPIEFGALRFVALPGGVIARMVDSIHLPAACCHIDHTLAQPLIALGKISRKQKTKTKSIRKAYRGWPSNRNGTAVKKKRFNSGTETR